MASKYYIPDLQKYEWQKAVIDKDVLTPPGSPAAGDRYLVDGVGTGAWAGQDYNIATWDGSAWIFAVKRVGMIVWVTDEVKRYSYDAANTWVAVSAGHVFANETLLDSYTQTEEDLADAVSKAHAAGSDAVGGDLSGTTASATVDAVGGKTAAEVAGAVDKAASYNSGLEVIEFNI